MSHENEDIVDAEANTNVRGYAFDGDVLDDGRAADVETLRTPPTALSAGPLRTQSPDAPAGVKCCSQCAAVEGGTRVGCCAACPESRPNLTQITLGAVRCWRCEQWSVNPDGTTAFDATVAPIPDGEQMAGRLAYWCPDDAPAGQKGGPDA